MNQQNLLVELLLAGFFAIACIRTSVPVASDGKLDFRNLLRLPGRLERMRRSRWQWFSMVALLLVIRLQKGMPLVAELTVALEFLVFLALPTSADRNTGSWRR
jgi:hypothetical protein